MSGSDDQQQYLVFSPCVNDSSITIEVNDGERVTGGAYMATGERWHAQLLLNALQQFVDKCVRKDVVPMVALGRMV